MGRLSTQKNPMSSSARLAVLFPDPESPVMITIREFFSSSLFTAPGKVLPPSFSPAGLGGKRRRGPPSGFGPVSRKSVLNH
jgi:hypothetical protein